MTKYDQLQNIDFLVPDEKHTSEDYAEQNKETAAKRIGCRIRKIRQEKGLSQAELGEKIGLSLNRIQQYENGYRTPKSELLKQISNALDVDTLALVDPTVSTYYGLMFAFFEMEELYGLDVKKYGKNYLLCFNNETINDFFKEWYLEKEKIDNLIESVSPEEIIDVVKAYNTWKNNFPKMLKIKHSLSLRDSKKYKILSRINELQNEIDIELQKLNKLKQEELNE